MNTTIKALGFALVACLAACKSEPEVEPVKLYYSKADIFPPNARSGLIAVIAKNSNGGVSVLNSTPIETAENLELPGSEIPNRSDAVIVILTYTAALDGVSPEFIRAGDSTTGLEPLAPLGIFRAKLGESSFKPVDLDSPDFSFILQFANSVHVSSDILHPPDVASPVCSITSPVAEATVRGNKVVSANASDDIGVTQVDFYLDSITSMPIGTDATSPYSISYNTTSTSNGSHTLLCVAKDASNKTGTSPEVSFVIDNQLPLVSITSPISGSTQMISPITLSANASDNVAVSRVQFYLDGIAFGSPDTTSPYSVAWTAMAANSGFHYVHAEATDSAGNTGVAGSVNFYVNLDTGNPTCAITAPASGSVVKGSMAVSANATDDIAVTQVDFYLDSTASTPIGTDTSSPYSINYNSALASNGAHSLICVAKDGSNKTGTSPTVSITIDNLGPSVSMSSPTAGSTQTTSPITLTANASDNIAVAGVQFYLDGAPFGSLDTSSPYTIPWAATSASNGSHSAYAIATDSAGNSSTAGSVTFSVSIDASNPTCAITAPAAGALVKGSIPVSASATDDIGVSQVDFYLDSTASTPIGTDTSSPYSINYNTTLASNGAHSLICIARDSSSKTGTSPNVSITIDNQVPTVSMTSPAAGSTLTSSPIALTANASDNVAIANVQFYIDGAPLGSPDTTSPYSFSWGATSANNGSRSVYSRATDTVGNTTTSSTVSFTVNIDANNPTCSITAPAAGALVKGSIPVSANATDNVAVSQVDFYLDSTATTPIGTDATSPYSISYNTTSVSNGAHTLLCIARDTSSNSGTSPAVSITVDNQAPAVSMSSPSGGSTQTTSPITLTASASDNIAIASVQFYLDGISFGASDTASPYTIPWAAMSANNGAHTTHAIATDTAGNTTTSSSVSFNVNIDANNPTCAITAPAAGALIKGSIAVSANATDNVAVSQVDFYLDSTATTPIGTDASSPYSISYNSTSASNGAHTLLCVARDTSSNSGTSPAVSITVDNQAPTVSMTSPSSGSTVVGSPITLDASASDNVAVASVQFYLDGAPFGSPDTASPYSVSWTLTTANNGAHTSHAVATDTAGNTTTSSSVSFTVNIDVTNPTCAISTPAAFALVRSSITVSANATDNVGVSRVDFYLDSTTSTPIGTDTSSPYSISYNSALASNGVHTLFCVARDLATNSGTSLGVGITIDNQAPTVSITSPSAGSTQTSSPVVLTANASDNVAITSVQFYIDGSPFGSPDTTSPYSINWTVTSANNGSHSTHAVASDTAGNTTTSSSISFTVNIDGSNPTCSITAPAVGALVKGSIPVSANATDNVAVSQVDFYLDSIVSTPIGSDTTSPYSITYNTALTSNGSHGLICVARDGSGNSGTSPSVSITVDNQAPTVSMSSPSGGSTQTTSPITLTASASDNIAIASVQFYLDGISFGASDTVSPYTIPWAALSANNGSHTTHAVATDTAGNTTTSSSVSFTVNLDSTAPTCAISAPAGGALVRGSIPVSANAADNIAVTQVDFFLDSTASTPIGTDATSPYSISYNTTSASNGGHTLLCIARDTANNNGTSPAVSITIDNQAPTVSIAAPAAGSTKTSSPITVTANASDNVGILSVQLYVDGLPLEDPELTAPYELPWPATSADNGPHTAHAVATDNVGNTTTSATVSFTVNIAATTPAAPTGLAAVRSSTNPTGEIQLTWVDAATNETSYVVERCTGSACSSFTTIATLAPNANSFADNSVNSSLPPSDGLIYRYQVRAVNATGSTINSNGSQQASTQLKTPTNVQAVANGGSSVTITWTDASNETSFAIYRCTGAGCSAGPQLGTSPQNVPSYTDSTVTPGTTYGYQVGAVSTLAGVNSGLSAPKYATPDATAPTVPGSFNGTAANCNKVDLSWTASTDSGGSGLAGYKVFRNGSQISSTSSLTYSDLTTLNSTSYTYFVESYDNAGNTSFASTTKSITTPPCQIWSADLGEASGFSGTVTPYGVAADGLGNSVVVGSFTGTVNFGAAPGSKTSTNGGDIFVLKYSSAGVPLWVKTFGGGPTPVSDDVATAVAVERSTSEIFVTGSFGGTSISFDGGVTNLPSYGEPDMFLLRLDANGNTLKSNGIGSAADESGKGIGLDTSGNIYVTGYFNTAVDFNGHFLPAVAGMTRTSNGLNDVFLVKYLKSTFAPVWAKSFGSAGNDAPNGLNVDASQNVIIGGYASQSINFGGGALPYTGAYDIFIAKFDPTGAHIGSVEKGGLDFEQVKAVATDLSGNIYVTGYYRGLTGPSDLGCGLLPWNNGPVINDAQNIYVMKYNSTLTACSWSRGLVGVGSDEARGIAIDSSGNVVITGFFETTVNFGAASLTRTSNGGFDVFVAKYSTANVPIWAMTYGTSTVNSNVYGELGSSVAVDIGGSSNQIFVSGHFEQSGSINFGATTFNNASGQDGFVLKMSP